MNAQRRTQYAEVVAEAEAKAAHHAAERAALDPKSRSYKADYASQTRWMDAQKDKADKHRAKMEAGE